MKDMDSLFQSYIEFLPKESILMKYDKIYDVFQPKPNSEQKLSPIFYGEYSPIIEKLWMKRKLILTDVQLIFNKYDFYLTKSYSKPEKCFLIYGKLDENYILINYWRESEFVRKIQIGIDISIRETKEFVDKILQIGEELEFIMLGSNYETFNSKWEELYKYLKQTPASKLIDNEDKFIEDVKNGKQKTDVPFIVMKK